MALIGLMEGLVDGELCRKLTTNAVELIDVRERCLFGVGPHVRSCFVRDRVIAVIRLTRLVLN